MLLNLVYRGNDLSSHFWPSVYFIKESILKFRTFPLWQPIFFSGMPLIGDPQNFSLYPPNILFLFLPLDLAFLFLFFIHLLFAGICTFFLLKSGFKKSALAGLVAAVSFVFSPKIFSHLEAGHYTMIVAFSWLPMFFLCFLSFFRKPSFRKSLFLSLILAILFITYVNVFYFAFLFFVLWILVEKPKALKWLPLIVLFFLGVASFQLLPQLELSGFSNRSSLTFNDAARPLWSFRLFFQSLLFPYIHGLENFGTENLLFPGILVGLLAVIGFFTLKKKQKWIFGLWIIFSLLYSLGSRIPFFIFFYRYAPFVKFMRVVTRLWIISTLLIATMAGLGIEWLVKKFKVFKNITFFLTALLLLELIFVDISIFKRKMPVSGPQTSGEVYQWLKQDSKHFRIYCVTDCLSVKEAVKIGKPVLGGNNSTQLKDYVEFLAKAAGYQYDKYIPILPPYEVFSQKPQPEASLMGLLNTKYLLSPYYLEDKDFVLEKEIGKLFIYQNSKAIGQAFLETEGEKMPLEIKSYSANKIVIELNPELEGRLVLAEIHYPGWQAKLDGERVPVKKAHQVLRSIPVPRGSQEAVFVYRPKSFFLGLGISLATLIIIGLVLKRR